MTIINSVDAFANTLYTMAAVIMCDSARFCEKNGQELNDIGFKKSCC